MKCPLLQMVWMRTKVGEKGRSPDCLKEECAWWDNAQSWCVVKALNMELVNIFVELKRIKDKMPHEGQFRK